ncbi:type II toxin-antitoxin system prevent-host-death family antitoxin [Spirillospora sp. NPDC052269]
MAITAREAREHLEALIQKVNDDAKAMKIVSPTESAYLVPADEYEALRETAHLLRSPENARRLPTSLQEALQYPK